MGICSQATCASLPTDPSPSRFSSSRSDLTLTIWGVGADASIHCYPFERYADTHPRCSCLGGRLSSNAVSHFLFWCRVLWLHAETGRTSFCSMVLPVCAVLPLSFSAGVIPLLASSKALPACRGYPVRFH